MGAVARARALVADRLKDPWSRSSTFLMMNTAMVAASGFVFWAIAARVATPEEVGVATAVVSALTLAAMFARLGFDVSILRVLPQTISHESHRFLHGAFTLTAGAGILAGLVLVAGAGWWSPELAFLREGVVTGAGLALLVVILAWGALMDSWFIARRRAELAFYKNGVHALLRVLLVLVLAPLLGAIGIVLGATASMAGAILVAGTWFVRQVDPGFRPRLSVWNRRLQEALPQSFANHAVSFLLILPASLGSLMVIRRFGAADAAFFYVVWLLGSLAMVAPGAFGQASLVEISHERERSRELRLRGLATSMLAGLGVLVLGSVMLPLLGSHYEAATAGVLLPFALSAAPAHLLHARLAHFRAASRNSALVVSVLAAVVPFLVGLAWLPITVTAVGWVWLASLGVGAATTLLLDARQRASA